MRNLRWLMLVFLLLPVTASAQLSAYHDRALAPVSVLGIPSPVMSPIAYGSVRVCNGNVLNISPCTPLASIQDFNGNALTVVGGNFGQVTTDVTGQFSFQCSSGTYTIQVAASASNTPQLNYLSACPNIGASGNLTLNNIWTGTNTFTGALNANGTNTLANLDGIVYIGGSVPQIGGSADIGAQTNSAYTATPSTGGNAVLFPQTGGGCYSSTTPITLATSGKYFSIGGTYTGNQTGGVNQGVCFNYTPTTATAAATIDWTPPTGGGYSPGAGLRDFQITNNGCITAGGCASSAIGLNIGPTNGGAHKALFQNVKQSGFSVGRQINDVVGWGITDVNSTFAYNGTGLKYNTTSHENDACFGCAFTVNGTGLDLGTGSNVELSVVGGSTDGNTVKGFNNGGGILYYTHHHFENPGCSSDLYGTMNGPTHMFGATVLEDCNSGTVAQLFTMTGNFLSANGLNVFSGGRTVTNLINNSTGGTAFITYSTSTPTLIAPGVNNSDLTKTCAIAYNCIVVRLIGATPQMQIPVITLPFAGAGDPSCTSLGGVSNLIWNKASTNRVTMCNNGGAADPVVGGATADTFSGVKSFNAGTLLPSAAGGTDVGSAALPFGNLWLGAAATNNFKFQPAATAAARTVAMPDPGTNVNLAFNLSATSAAFATATTAGTCVQNTTAVTGAATTMVATASPVSTPGVGAVWSAFVSSAGNVTIDECAVATSAGGTIAFNIRVTP